MEYNTDFDINNDENFENLFSATDVHFYTVRNSFNIRTVTRSMLYNTRYKILLYMCKTIFLLVSACFNYCVTSLS